MEEITATIVGLLFLVAACGLPVWLTGKAFKAVIRRRRLLTYELGRRGAVHHFDTPLTIGVILFGAGAVFAGINLLPLAVWILDGDPEARRVFIAFWPIVAFMMGCGRLAARPGLRLFVAEPDRLTTHRTGVLHRPGRERSIGHAEITGFHERRTLLGSVEVRGAGAVRRIRVNAQTGGFDQLIAALRQAAPHAPYTSFRDRTGAAPTDPDPRHWGVAPARTRLTIGFLGALLLFFWTWPWLFVTGDHPTRDSLIFMGIGTGMWLIVALLVGQENFQRSQPAELELRPGTIAWRRFLAGWTERPVTEIVTATVETDIIYVRGFPGYRHPLRLRFVDGDELVIDDARARHLRTSTVQLGAAIRAHLHDLDQRDPSFEQLAASDDAAATAADEATSARLRRAAIARWPDRARLATLATVGDLHRRIGDHDLAISLYRAHLDHDADSADAWQGLAASFRAKHREDLAGEATLHAERILLGG